MRSGIGSSLLRGHERSPLDAAVSTFHSLSKFPLLPCGATAFVAGVALGMSGPRRRRAWLFPIALQGELADPDGNTTPIDAAHNLPPIPPPRQVKERIAQTRQQDYHH